MKQAENYCVRELVKQIENHPHRQALQQDLQQNNAYNPLSEKSKKMIKDMGSVELFQLCETIRKVHCEECLLYWNRGIVHCTCGRLLRENESNRHLHQWRLDALSIPNYVVKNGREASRGFIQCTLDLLSVQNYVIKKGRHHGHRHGKT